MIEKSVSSRFCEYSEKKTGKSRLDKSSAYLQIAISALNICNMEKGIDVEIPETDLGYCPVC